MLQCPKCILKESLPNPKPADGSDKILKVLNQLQEKTAPKPKSTITAADHYHPFRDQAAGEFHPGTQEQVSQIVTQVICQELHRQNKTQANYQNTRGRRSSQGQPICDFCNRWRHVIAPCRQQVRQTRGQTPGVVGTHKSQILLDSQKQTRTEDFQIIRFAHTISNI